MPNLFIAEPSDPLTSVYAVFLVPDLISRCTDIFPHKRTSMYITRSRRNLQPPRSHTLRGGIHISNPTPLSTQICLDLVPQVRRLFRLRLLKRPLPPRTKMRSTCSEKTRMRMLRLSGSKLNESPPTIRKKHRNPKLSPRSELIDPCTRH